MPLKTTIGFLGCGNMGSAILAGLIKKKIVPAAKISVYDAFPAKAREVKRKFKVGLSGSPAEIARRSRVIVLAMKPQDFAAAASSLRPHLTPRHLIITILAGVPISRIRRELGGRSKVVRAMPNLGATVGEGVTAITGSSGLGTAGAIFSGCGPVLRLPERLFDLVTAVSGSGPAYFFFVMELLMREARRNGLPEKDADILVKQTALGASVLASQSRESVSKLRERVTSKGGTTEAALRTMESGGMPEIFKGAIKNAVKRARQLGAK